MAVTPEGQQPPEGWQEDPAARFRQPLPPRQAPAGAPPATPPQPQRAPAQQAAPSFGGLGQPQAPAQPAPAPQRPAPAPQPTEAPDLTASLEAGLRCLFQPGDVFGQLRGMRCPDYVQMLLAAVTWIGGGAALGIVLGVMRSPVDLGIVPLTLAVAGAAVCAVPAAFLAAGVLHCLAMVSGGQGPFERSFQAVSLLAIMAPVAAAATQIDVPFVWVAPTLYATFLAVRSVEVLHEAPGGQAWLVVGLAGVLSVAGQAVAYRGSAEFQRRLGHLINIYSTSKPGEQAAAAQEPPPQPVPVEPAPEPQPQALQQQEQPPQRSSMDMVQQPTDSGGGALPILPSGSAGQANGGPMGGNPFETGELPSRNLGQMQQQSGNLFSKISEQLQNNPNMPPEQKAKMQQLMDKANQMASGKSGGQNASQMLQDPNFQKMIADVLGMVQKAQGQNPQQGQPTSKKRRSKRKVAVEETQPKTQEEEPLPAQ